MALYNDEHCSELIKYFEEEIFLLVVPVFSHVNFSHVNFFACKTVKIVIRVLEILK